MSERKWQIGIAALAVLALLALWSSAPPARAVAREQTSHDQALRSLVLTRADAVRGALGSLRHTTYENDGTLVPDVLENGAPLLLLGKDRAGRILGLTTQCAVTFRFPDYCYWDPEEMGSPEFEIGVAELTFPGRTPSYVLVDQEMDWKAAELPQWHQGYSEYFAKAMPRIGGSVTALPEVLKVSAGDVDRLRHFHALRQSRTALTFESLGNNDLALVSLPGVDGLQTLGLENPRDKVIQMLKDIPFSKMLGRDFLLRCENCVARMENKRVRPSVPFTTASLAKVGCLLVAKECVPFLAAAMDLIPTMVQMVSEGSTGLEAAGKMERLAKTGQLGPVLDLTTASTIIRSGHLIEVDGGRYRLAHVHTSDARGREALERAFREARDSGWHVLAIVEATAFDGEFITHLVVPETKTYLNLKLVQEGVAQAFGHREPLRTAGLFDLMRLQERLVLK